MVIYIKTISIGWNRLIDPFIMESHSLEMSESCSCVSISRKTGKTSSRWVKSRLKPMSTFLHLRSLPLSPPINRLKNSLGSGIKKECRRPESPEVERSQEILFGSDVRICNSRLIQGKAGAAFTALKLYSETDSRWQLELVSQPFLLLPKSGYIFNTLITLLSEEGNSMAGENQSEKATSLHMLLYLFKFEIC